MLIGRDNERKILQDALTDEYSLFIAVYGRRRVGKTFLIRESYDYHFTFQFTGAAKIPARKQLARFRMALKEHGLTDMPPVFSNWIIAFSELKRFITLQPEGKKIIFLDELPWMDAPRSGFLSELESFWNGWASARKDIVFVVCGSATSWMVKKIIKNKGGLHNRLTHRIALKPFSLRLCEELMASRGIEMTRKQILNGYMIFGGVPYYWSLLQKGVSLSQEVDRLIFSNEGDMYDEFSMLYAALFKKPEPYIKVISLLAGKKEGMTRLELIEEGGLEDNGKLTDLLNDLEWCDFIRGSSVIGKQTKDEIFQLIDHYTLFYYEYINGKRHGINFWQATEGTPRYYNWCGRAFERVCLCHTDQIKQKLGISGILTEEYAWRYIPKKKKEDEEPAVAKGKRKKEGCQVDLLIDRSDGIIDLCEMKYHEGKFTISESYQEDLNNRKNIFKEASKTQKAVHNIMVTTDGLAHNAYSKEIQNEVCLGDLFL